MLQLRFIKKNQCFTKNQFHTSFRGSHNFSYCVCTGQFTYQTNFVGDFG